MVGKRFTQECRPQAALAIDFEINYLSWTICICVTHENEPRELYSKPPRTKFVNLHMYSHMFIRSIERPLTQANERRHPPWPRRKALLGVHANSSRTHNPRACVSNFSQNQTSRQLPERASSTPRPTNHDICHRCLVVRPSHQSASAQLASPYIPGPTRACTSSDVIDDDDTN